MSTSIHYVITDVHMGLGHDGLSEVIKQHKKKNPLFAKSIQSESGLILFLNRSRTRAKLFHEHGNVIGYLKLTGERKLTQNSIDLIPLAFGGSAEYSKSARTALKSLLAAESARGPIAKTALYA